MEKHMARLLATGTGLGCYLRRALTRLFTPAALSSFLESLSGASLHLQPPRHLLYRLSYHQPSTTMAGRSRCRTVITIPCKYMHSILDRQVYHHHVSETFLLLLLYHKFLITCKLCFVITCSPSDSQAWQDERMGYEP
jgi:hypothetical protein